MEPFVEGWPLAKGALVFVATFILEDAAAVGAGAWLAAGQITWPIAFSACFLGIWLGDAGLYVLARWGGRSWFERSSLRKFSARVQQSERWFVRRGAAILVFSRVIPGARLPTYLAAGFLRVPFFRFMVITGMAASVWTLLLLRVTRDLGGHLQAWLNLDGRAHLGMAGALLGGALLVTWMPRTLRGIGRRSRLAQFGRWRRWEFWPAPLFYLPVVIYCLWLAMKHRGLTLPTSANPGMRSGGVVGESKMATLRELLTTNPDCTAAAWLIPSGTFEERCQVFESAWARLTESGLVKAGDPVVLKPDVGQRGAGVKLIRTRAEAADYFRRTDAPLVIQRYMPGPFEVGIFYYRYPGATRGRIFAITEKLFPVVIGDGTSTVEQLIRNDPRAKWIAETYLRRMSGRRIEIPGAGQTLKLVETGNHAQGCIFRDGSRFWSEALESRIDAISRSLDGFYIGRYDIRYECEEDLRAGKGFHILELNGAAAEATSIYDARNSLRDAYRTLFRQWELVYAIGAENRRRGHRTTRPISLWKEWRQYTAMAMDYPVAD